MIMQQVPQFLDTQDKIVGPLTWTHLYWFFGAGILLLIMWNTLDRGTFWVLSVPIVLATIAFAFYKPQGMTLTEFLGHSFLYYSRPNVYMWQREKYHVQKRKKKIVTAHNRGARGLNDEVVHNISKALDSHGQIRNERIDEILRDRARNSQK